MLRNLASPLYGNALVFVFCSALVILLVLRGGLMAIPLSLVFLGSLGAYCVALIDALAMGRPTPVLSIEMLNPTHDARPLLAGILIGLALVLSITTYSSLGVYVGSVIVTLIALLMPASVALLCVDSRRIVALSPWHCVRLAARLGGGYVLFVIIALIYMGILKLVGERASFYVFLISAETALLSLAAALGGLLNDRRTDIGLHAPSADEVNATQETAHESGARDALLADVYTKVRVGRVQEGWTQMETWLTERGYRPDVIRDLQTRTMQWDDRRISDRLVRELISRYLRLGENAAALDTIEAWLDQSGNYRPASARELGRLIGLARTSARNSLSERLLDQAGEHFASDPEIAGLLASRGNSRSP